MKNSIIVLILVMLILIVPNISGAISSVTLNYPLDNANLTLARQDFNATCIGDKAKFNASPHIHFIFFNIILRCPPLAYIPAALTD